MKARHVGGPYGDGVASRRAGGPAHQPRVGINAHPFRPGNKRPAYRRRPCCRRLVGVGLAHYPIGDRRGGDGRGGWPALDEHLDVVYIPSLEAV